MTKKRAPVSESSSNASSINSAPDKYEHCTTKLIVCQEENGGGRENRTLPAEAGEHLSGAFRPSRSPSNHVTRLAQIKYGMNGRVLTAYNFIRFT